MSAKHFTYLVQKGNPVGQVEAVNRYLVRVAGLQPVNLQALVMFEDGSKGIVREIADNYVSIMHLGSKPVKVGTSAVVQHHELVVKVGSDFVGRVVSVSGEPLDGKGPIASDAVWPVFNTAPPLIGRQELNDQLTTGVTLIDALFPIVLGQRIAILGDSKTGKSTLMTQLALNQHSSDRIVVYAMIAKRRVDVDMLLSKLQANDALKNAIVVVSTMFDSLTVSYLAPYVACSLAEYLWQVENRDVIVVYDDLTNHAHAYREISLLGNVSPGRDSYPGDMFFAHSSLLERAGRLAESGKTFTSLPIVHVPGGDITTYLPTNIMSITDGQFILDMDIFRSGMRPALSTGLSVSRVGGRGHNERQKEIAGRIMKQLAQFSQASEFAHFGSELAIEARKDLEVGKHLQETFSQGPSEFFTLEAQQLMLDIILDLEQGSVIDIAGMKASANEFAATVKDEASFAQAKQQLRDKVMIEVKR